MFTYACFHIHVTGVRYIQLSTSVQNYFFNADRLEGVVLIAPVINYWWPGFPANLTTEAYRQQNIQDQWALRVAHYAPWLTYWWNTQQWFPGSGVISGSPHIFSREDKEILAKMSHTHRKSYAVSIQHLCDYKIVVFC